MRALYFYAHMADNRAGRVTKYYQEEKECQHLTSW